MTTDPAMPTRPPEIGNSRTEAALQRLQKAMAGIEADIVENNGIYPFNFVTFYHHFR